MTLSIEVGAADDGTLTYLVDRAPSELPPVSGRDLLAAWQVAREAAHRAAWSTGRAFRFRRADGGWTDLALHDQDARCWAGAVDRAVGMETGYGLSVCLRLLALVDLLARAPWTAPLIEIAPQGADLHPALVRLAAQTRLTDEASFDESGFRARLQTMPPRGPAAACGSKGVPLR
jgi:hypothetical protein